MGRFLMGVIGGVVPVGKVGAPACCGIKADTSGVLSGGSPPVPDGCW